MKKITLFGLIILLSSGCGVTLQSVVDSNLTKTYDNPLIVIPYIRNSTLNFSENLKYNLEKKFSAGNQKVEVILVEQSSKDELTLNSNDDSEIRINNAIERDNKDLILVFKPVRLQYYNNGLQSVSYQIVGTDIKTKKEVWKANFSSFGSFGPSAVASAASIQIYQKLKDDKILK